MSRSLLTLLAAAALMCVPRPVHGSTVTVPDDVSTVQQALDGVAETIVVRASAPVESVTVGRSVVLVAWASPSYGLTDLPTLSALAIGPCSGRDVSVRGFRIERGVSALGSASDLRLTLESCRIESGGVRMDGGLMFFFTMRGCTIRGHVVAAAFNTTIEASTIRGALELTPWGTCWLLGNDVIGPADAGIFLNDTDGWSVIRWSTITDCEVGVAVRNASGVVIADNVITGCEQAGVRTLHATYGMPHGEIARNQLNRCGVGIELQGGWFTVLDNVVADASAEGIHLTGGVGCRLTGNRIERAGGHGVIALDPYLELFARNVLLDCAGGGAEIEGVVRADSNVIAGCGGAGLTVQVSPGTMLVRMNTLYLNHGPGLDLGGGAGDSLRGNVSSDNDGVGLLWRGAKAPVMACNDWWNNAGGPTSGVSPGPSDVALAPMFCDALARNLHLSAISPLLGLPCGPVGALGVGCAEPVAVRPPAGVPAPFAAWPQPSSGAVQFTWGVGRAGRLDVFDARGARVWSADVSADAGELRWNGADAAGRACAPGVYFARLERGTERRSTRVVLAR